MKTIKAGIIGTGFIGPAHVEAARRVGFVEMLGLCEANPELAKSKADKLNIPRSYGSVKDFLADASGGLGIIFSNELPYFSDVFRRSRMKLEVFSRGHCLEMDFNNCSSR